MLKKKKRPTVLVVEDDIQTLKVLEQVLNKTNWNVHFIQTGEEALKNLERIHPDLIVLDLILPKMNGFEILKALRQEKKFTRPVVILSNLSSDEDIAQGLRLGADEYFVKGRISVLDLPDKLSIYLS